MSPTHWMVIGLVGRGCFAVVVVVAGAVVCVDLPLLFVDLPSLSVVL